MKKSIVMGAALVMAFGALVTSPIYAACSVSTPMSHVQAGFFNCPDPDPGPTGPDPVQMYSWSMSSPTTSNSNGLSGVCFDVNRNTGTGLGCAASFMAGTAGDGNVAVAFDWQIPGTTGCPSANPGNGDGPVAISLVTSNGTGALVTVGTSTFTAGYVVDLAFPFDAGSGAPSPVACSPNAGVKYVSGAPGGTVCVNAPAPTIVSDCDPNSTSMAGLGGDGGSGASCLLGTPVPVVGRGHIYQKEAACKTTPDLRISSGWTLLAASPDATGAACNPVPAPTVSSDCMFIGTTSTLGGVETPAITGIVQVPGPGAAGDKVSIKNATLDQGKLNVNYSTENEMTIVGFNVYAGSAKLNASLISAKGTGSNSYNFSVGRGAVKNNRTVTVEAVLSNGATVRSNTVTLK